VGVLQPGFASPLEVENRRNASAPTETENDCRMKCLYNGRPVLNGVDAAHLIRGMLGENWVSIFALTAEALQGYKERFLGLGFDGYLSKPLQTHTLQDTLKSITSLGLGALARPIKS
jgi:CheY-like chemotaxis protein